MLFRSVLENGTYANKTSQPKTCHMQFFRQVVSPLGLYNCPVYRNQEHGKVGDKHGYSDAEGARSVKAGLVELLENFDASHDSKTLPPWSLGMSETS